MSPDCPLSFLYWGPKGGWSVFSGAATRSLCSAATHSCGQEEVERQELKPCDAVTAADAMELDALVVVNVKPAVLGDSKQCLRMQKPGRSGVTVQRERASPAVIQSGIGCLSPTAADRGH